jgi:hypothetical protein
MRLSFASGAEYYQWCPKELKDEALSTWTNILGTKVGFNEDYIFGQKLYDYQKLLPNGPSYSVEWVSYFRQLSDAAWVEIKKEMQDKLWEEQKKAKMRTYYENLTPEEAAAARKRDASASAAEERNKSTAYISEELKIHIDLLKELFSEYIQRYFESSTGEDKETAKKASAGEDKETAEKASAGEDKETAEKASAGEEKETAEKAGNEETAESHVKDDLMDERKRSIYNKAGNWAGVKKANRRGAELNDVREQAKYQYLFGKRFGK